MKEEKLILTPLEQRLLKNLIVINSDIHTVIMCFEKNNPVKAGAIIGERIQLIRKLIQDSMTEQEGLKEIIEGMGKELSTEVKAMNGEKKGDTQYFG